jgi:hypothetical protein
LINWTPPVLGGGDPWLDGVALKMLLGTREQARSVAGGLLVAVNTEPQAQTVSERNTRVELINKGALSLRSVLVVGPSVDVSAARDASPEVKALTTDQPVELSLPYDATAVSRWGQSPDGEI